TVKLFAGADDNYPFTITLLHTTQPLYYRFTLTDMANNSVYSGYSFVEVYDNDLPTIVDESEGPGTTGDQFSIIIRSQDNIEIISVKINWAHGTLGGLDVPMSQSGQGRWTLSVQIDDDLTNLTYQIFVEDSSMNIASTEVWSITIIDNDRPSVSLPREILETTTGDSITIISIIEDNIGVGGSYFEFWNPNSSRTNHTMVRGNNMTWSYTIEIPLDDITRINFLVHAMDTSGNWGISGMGTILIGDDIGPRLIRDFSAENGLTGKEYEFILDVDDNIGVRSVSVMYWFGEVEGELITLVLGEEHYIGTIEVPIDSLEDWHYLIKIIDGSENSF
ncbi:MAG: hypothetical protein KAH57_03550, partial [Thermoplasmata archaeon]|nr:hypothetical protein [Thermoplasmata archaeon]